MFKRIAAYVAPCTAALCVIASASSAQPNDFHFGGQVGWTQARLTDMSGMMYQFNVPVFGAAGVNVIATGGNTKYNSGVAFGGWGSYVINPKFGLQLGVFFTQQGGTLSQSGTQIIDDPAVPTNSTTVEYQFEHDVEVRYVRFPLLAKIQYPFNRVTPFVKLGPDIGILTAARLETNGTYRQPAGSSNQLVPISESEDYKGRFNKIGVSLHAAAGVDVPVGSAAVYAEFAYSFGLTDAHDSSAGIFSKGVKNSVLTASLGFFF